MIYFIIIILLLCIDLISKNYIKNKYQLNRKVSIYKNKIFIWHIKNEGLVYGILKKNKNITYILMSICIVFIFILFFKSFKSNSKLKKLAFSFALSGGFSNFIDRIKNKNITDFIYIKIKNAPIFNFADIFLVISIILIFTKEIKDYFFKKV